MNDKTNATILLLWLVPAILSCVAVGDSWGDNLEVTISSSKRTYVVGEPVKFEVRITNVSNETQRTVDIRYLNDNMEYMLLEITTPNGMVETRSTQYSFSNWIPNPDYRGEPLAPGDHVVTFLYPNFSKQVDPESGQIIRDTFRRTFHESGLYKVRVAYFVKEYQVVLRQSVEGKLYSNYLNISCRTPTAPEKGILDAYWTGANVAAKVDDVSGWGSHDAAALRGVIEKYPNEPTIKYAYFGLFRSMSRITAEGSVVNLDEALAMSQVIRDKFPGFRFFEVRRLTADALATSGFTSDALMFYQEALTKMPQLKHYYGFMGSLIKCREGSVEKVFEWERRRERGDKNYDMEIGAQ